MLSSGEHLPFCLKGKYIPKKRTILPFRDERFCPLRIAQSFDSLASPACAFATKCIIMRLKRMGYGFYAKLCVYQCIKRPFLFSSCFVVLKIPRHLRISGCFGIFICCLGIFTACFGVKAKCALRLFLKPLCSNLKGWFVKIFYLVWKSYREEWDNGAND